MKYCSILHGPVFVMSLLGHDVPSRGTTSDGFSGHWSIFSYFCIFICFVVAIFDLVYGVEAIWLTTSGNLF